jgi:hypothetical protein
MKIILIAIVIVSSILGGCDRQTLDGLNLKFKGELNSDYKNSQTETKNSSESQSNTEEKTSSKEEVANNETKNTSEVVSNKEVKEVQETSNSNPDAPLPFKQVKECSDAGIIAETNKIFYAQNPNVKSINSKNEEQVKAWKLIKNEVKEKCENN